MKTFFLNKFYYGDIPEENAGGNMNVTKEDNAHAWPLWEVFVRSKQGLDHKHVGSLHATDATKTSQRGKPAPPPPKGGFLELFISLPPAFSSGISP